MTDIRSSKRKPTPQTAEQIFERGIEEAQNAGVFRKRTQRAVNWYLRLIKDLAPTKMSRASFTSESRHRSGIRPGSMYFYVYDAKTKDVLPYWDKFPLVVPIGPNQTGTGWYGLNLHYVPLQYRAKILLVLYRVQNNKRYDETTKIKLSREFLESLTGMEKALTKVAFKQYLAHHVRSKFIYIHPDEWPIAMFLPAEQWQKKDFNSVYFDIGKKIKDMMSPKVKKAKAVVTKKIV